MKVEDDVQLANVAIVLVHLLNVAMHNFEGYELIIGVVGGCDEEEGGVAAVNYLGVYKVSGMAA